MNQSLIRLLYEECLNYGYCFIDNGAVSERKLCKNGIHLIESGKIIVAKVSLIIWIDFTTNEPLSMGILDKASNFPEKISRINQDLGNGNLTEKICQRILMYMVVQMVTLLVCPQNEIINDELIDLLSKTKNVHNVNN